MYLLCHMTAHYHLIEGSCEFIGGSSLENVPILASFVIVEIRF